MRALGLVFVMVAMGCGDPDGQAMRLGLTGSEVNAAQHWHAAGALKTGYGDCAQTMALDFDAGPGVNVPCSFPGCTCMGTNDGGRVVIYTTCDLEQVFHTSGSIVCDSGEGECTSSRTRNGVLMYACVYGMN